MPVVPFVAEDAAQTRHRGPGHGVGVELALGCEEHVMPPYRTEAPEVRVEVSEEQKSLLSALGHIQALGPEWASYKVDEWLDGVRVLLDLGSVEVASSPGNSP